MRTNWHKALLVSFVLITSSLAGCLNNDDDDNGELEGQYGTVMVSTYHVGQLVSAITGDTVNVQTMSQDNIPVHDYEPSIEDIVSYKRPIYSCITDWVLSHGRKLR